MISLHDISIIFKGILVLIIAWFSDTIIVKFVSLSFVNPFVRDFFIETKDILSWLISFVLLITVIIKLRNERRKK